MQALKIITLILSIIGFLLLSLLFVAGRGADQTILDETFYEEVFEETDLAELISRNLGSLIGEAMEQDMEAAEQELHQPLDESFDADWVEDNATNGTANLIAWLKGEQDSAVLLDLSEQQEQLTSSLRDHFEDLSTEELREIGLSDEEVAAVRAGHFDYEESIPRQLSTDNLADDAQTDIQQRRDTFQANYDRYQTWVPIALIIFGVLLLVTLGVFNGLKWVGGFMLLAGGGVAVAAYASRGVLSVAVSTALGEEGASTVLEVIALLTNRFAQPALIYAAAGLAVLILSIIVQRLYRRRTEIKQYTAQN